MGLRPRVLALVGPTGTGKTELACALARRTDAEIISCDSMQVYRRLDIGTAKPSAELRNEIPHHAIDIVEPDDPGMSAGRYAELARTAAHDISARGRRVILAGGSGLYARAFAGGLIEGVDADPELRARLEALPDDELRARLQEADPAAAQRIPPADRVRAVRALEAHALADEPISAQHERHGFADRPFEICQIALDLDRDRLAERLHARVERMFEQGLVEEVRALLAAYPPTLRPLQAIGYKEVGALLRGDCKEDEARELIATATRRYAKRQRTWFRAEPELTWMDADDPEALLERAARFLEC